MKNWLINLSINREYCETLMIRAEAVTKLTDTVLLVDHIEMEFTHSMIEIEEVKEK